MTTYDPKDWTWGTELEWGDIRKDVEVPPELGIWDWSEVGIINIRPPYAGLAADPQGKEPPVGGEINVRPSLTIEGQIQKIDALKKLFEDHGCPPTVSNVNGLHFHTFVPGLTEDIEALKRLIAYNKKWAKALSEAIYGFQKDPRMKRTKSATRRLSNRTLLMPDWMADNIINMAEDFEDFIRIHCCGKDGVSRGRPFRYHVNTYQLKHIGTIEWRGPGATLDLDQIRDLMQVIEAYLFAALNDGQDFPDILASREWDFPQFSYIPAHFEAWERTKHPDESGEKVRTFIPVEELT